MEPIVKDYLDLTSILQPLMIYFSILIVYSAMSKTAKLAVAVLLYISILTKLSIEFE